MRAREMIAAIESMENWIENDLKKIPLDWDGAYPSLLWCISTCLFLVAHWLGPFD